MELDEEPPNVLGVDPYSENHFSESSPRLGTNYSTLVSMTSPKHPKINIIGLAFNPRPDNQTLDSDNVALEYDEPETIEAIRDALESAGYEVVLLEANEHFLETVQTQKIDIVFNIAEGIRGESRESHIPAILEMFGIPYTGSGVLTQAITLSKSRTKEILDYYRIPTPKFQKFFHAWDKLNSKLQFPLIVKPDAEGSSVGITNNSVVHNKKELRDQVSYVLSTYRGPALVEEFCSGREFTVGVISNNPIQVLPIIEVTFDHLPKQVEKIDSYESKWIFDVPEMNIDPLICPARIPHKLQKKIEKIAIQTCEVLGIMDFARMDIRLDKKGVPNVLEINALPGLNPNPNFHSRFPYACHRSGISYREMILKVLNAGIMRYYPESVLSKHTIGMKHMDKFSMKSPIFGDTSHKIQ